jgi:hypothetical protein
LRQRPRRRRRRGRQADGAGPDQLQGGPGKDDVRGGGHDAIFGEQAVGDVGNDIMFVGASGTGGQIAEGDEGYDLTRVSGSGGAGTFPLAPASSAVRLEGTVDGESFLAHADSEGVMLLAGAGNDTVTTQPGHGGRRRGARRGRPR